jgi:DNA-binding LacI/PurR family transcriptional regulator
VGDRLPTTAELSETFACSVGMVSKAIAMLVHEGLVEQKPKLGTRVVSNEEKCADGLPKLGAYAFIYPSEQHEGIWRTLKGFQDVAHAEGRQVVLLSAGADCRKEIEFVSRISEFDVRGAVIYPILLSARDQVQFSQVLLDAEFPVVLAEVNLLGMERPSVTLDGYHAGYTMTRHLLERGAKKIGFLANYARVPSVRDRHLGYRSAMEEAGIPIQKEWVALESAMHPDFGDPLKESTELARHYLQQAGAVDGVVCVNDFLATGLVNAAVEKGLQVPRDLKITGMEDFALAQSNPIPLTTYHVPFEKMGAQAYRILDSLLSGHPLESIENQIRGRLMIRNST